MSELVPELHKNAPQTSALPEPSEMSNCALSEALVTLVVPVEVSYCAASYRARFLLLVPSERYAVHSDRLLESYASVMVSVRLLS